MLMLPNGCTTKRAESLLHTYDMRRRGGYKNQVIAAREQVKFVTGMTVTDLRKWLARPQEETLSKTASTVEYLRRCQAARAAGRSVSFTTDPAWLVEQAINRRGGYVEDVHTRGSCLPVNGRLPRKARGDWQRRLHLIAREINTPRLIVRAQRLGEHAWLVQRLPHRFDNPAY